MKAASAALVAMMALYDPCFFSDDRAMTMFPDETMADRVTRQHEMQMKKSLVPHLAHRKTVPRQCTH